MPPAVVGITPGRGEEHRVDAPVVITFDQPMDAETTDAAFSLEPAVPGLVQVRGAQLTFTPAEPFKRGAEYRVTLAATAASASGLQMLQPMSFRFTTAGLLEVTNTQPSDGTDDAAVDSAITLAFNRPVVPLSAAATGTGSETGTILVITPTLTGKGEWINTSIYRFTPEKGLAASTSYSVTVKAGLADTTGGLLAEPYTFRFHTADPTLLTWQPENTINAKIEQPITATFSMAMDRDQHRSRLLPDR